MDTSDGNFEKKLLSNQTLPVVVSKMNLRIYQRITPIVLATQILLTPATKEVAADAELGSVLVNRTLRIVISTGVNIITPGDMYNDVIIKHAPSPVLVVTVANFPPCGLSIILQVAKKR